MSRRKKCIFDKHLCRQCGCMYLIDETKIDSIEEEIKMRKVTIDEDVRVDGEEV